MTVKFNTANFSVSVLLRTSSTHFLCSWLFRYFAGVTLVSETLLAAVFTG